MTAMFEFRCLCNAHAQLHAPSPASPARCAPDTGKSCKKVLASYLVWHSQPLAKNVGSGTDSVLDLSVSQCALQANQIQSS